LGFDGIDINMGCPAKNVSHSGAGAALIQTPKLAQEIIRAVKIGIQDWQNGQSAENCPNITPAIATEVNQRHQRLPARYQTGDRLIPVSIKTRVGYHQEVVDEWIPHLLELEPAAIAIHGRTLKQQYGGQANWELIGRAAEVARGTSTLILGNGDVTSYDQALVRVADYGLAGVLIGRAAMGNPYVFQPASDQPPTISTFKIAIEHAQLFEQTFQHQDRYTFLPMRKHLGWYVREVPNASQIRVELFKTNTSQEVEAVLREHGLL
jgi:tRNA-dihydrouridine synthase